MKERVLRISNGVLSVCAGISSFLFTFAALLFLRNLDEKILASVTMGSFALLIVWIASERPNSAQGRAVAALIKRLMSVGSGDFTSPVPPLLKKEMPPLASAVESLFEQVRSSLADVQAMALYDPVTSLPNRLFFKKEGERMLASLGPDDQAAMLFIDLDGFKEVNDTLGHAQGDLILEMVADRLRSMVTRDASPDRGVPPVVARLSGDEFTLLIAVANVAQATRKGEEVLALLSQPFHSSGQIVQIGASVGVALWPQHSADLASLMKASDIAMYEAKARGRSRICLYDQELGSSFARRGEVERSLRHAVTRQEFALHYQPQVCARTGRTQGVEALLRWHHPTEGLVGTDEFICVAEESSLIASIGDWILDEVSDVMGRWRSLGLDRRIGINISPGQLDQTAFFHRLSSAVAKGDLPGTMLELELTETGATQCNEALTRQLTSLREFGVSIAIDDFGSGYSNLARLQAMPLDRIKLDRSLVRDIATSESARNMIASIIHLIHGLGCQVVAEGVERPEQVDVLRTVGCDTFQGRLFAAPMDEAEFLGWVDASEAGALRQTA